MGRIVVSENVSFDGVVQDPTGEEGSRKGGWFLQVTDNDRGARAKVMLDEALGAEAFLLGRRTYEFLAARWPSRSGELADRLNSLPKYVVSSTSGSPSRGLRRRSRSQIRALPPICGKRSREPGGRDVVRGPHRRQGPRDDLPLIATPTRVIVDPARGPEMLA